jgi:hypothetical protein
LWRIENTAHPSRVFEKLNSGEKKQLVFARFLSAASSEAILPNAKLPAFLFVQNIQTFYVFKGIGSGKLRFAIAILKMALHFDESSSSSEAEKGLPKNNLEKVSCPE